jgi:glycosyltransferase involved in cell wall biosynthesis
MTGLLRVLVVVLTENETMRGVERYALELVRALALRYPQEIKITLLCGEWQRYFLELRSLGVHVQIAACGKSKASRHVYLATRIRGLSGAFDIVHYGNLLPIAIRNKVPSTMTIHDVAEFALQHKYSGLQRIYRRVVGWRAIRAVARIVTDSEFTRTELRRHLGVHSDRVTVIYPGVDHFRNAAVTTENLDVTARHCL